MAGKVVWDEAKFQAALTREFTNRIKACSILVANHAKQLISVDGTSKSAKTRDSKGKFLKQRLKYGANPSQPGEPPHVQTGRLRGSVAWEVVAKVGRVGTNLLYGRWLELGTRKMKARPWLRRSLNECKDQIKAIMSRPVKF